MTVKSVNQSQDSDRQAANDDRLTQPAARDHLARTTNPSLECLPYLICALPSLLLLAFVPPTFNFWDSATLISSQLSFLVPHWPPIYPLFVAFNIFWFGFTDAGIYAIVASQHIIAALAAIYVITAYKGLWQRSLLAAMFAPANYFFVLTHGIYTEALSTSFLFILIGGALRLALRDDIELDRTSAQLTLELARTPGVSQSRKVSLTPRTVALTLSFLSLVAMTLTRHNMIVFAALLPAIYLFKAAFFCPGQKLKPFIVSVLVGVLAIFAVQLSNEFMCKILGNDSSPKYGRPAVYRLHDLPWATMPETERAHLMSNIQKRCPDDFSRVALSIMINNNEPWIGSYKQIHALEASFGGHRTADQAMNDAVKAFFLTPNRYLGAAIFKDFIAYMGFNNETFSSFIKDNTLSLNTYRAGKSIQPSFGAIPMIQNIDISKYNLISSIVNPSMFDGICNYMVMMVVAIVAAAVAAFRGASRNSLTVLLALSAAAILYAGISATITIVIPRYLAPVNAVAWLMLAVSFLSYKKNKPA